MGKRRYTNTLVLRPVIGKVLKVTLNKAAVWMLYDSKAWERSILARAIRNTKETYEKDAAENLFAAA